MLTVSTGAQHFVSNYLILCQIVYNPLTQCQALLVKLLWSNYLTQYKTVSVHIELNGFHMLGKCQMVLV